MKKIKNLIIACDAESASGKSTAAKLISKKYNLLLINSGLLYRYASKLVIKHNPRNELLFLKKLSNKFSSTEINYLKIAKEFYELSQKIYFNDNPHEISNEAIKYNDMIDKLLKSDCSDVIKHYLSNIFHHTGQILSYRLQLMFLDK